VPPDPDGGGPAYAIFTSGTSGRRRCVVVGRRQLDALAAGLRSTVYDGTGDRRLRVAMHGPLAFDTSVKQLLQLREGHTLVLVPDDVRSDPAALRRHLREHRVDVIDATPATVRWWLDRQVVATDQAVDRLLIGGEPIAADLWARLEAIDGLLVFNLYGPTEATVDATVALVRGGRPHIGRPLPHVRLSIEDGDGRPVPDYVVGEIALGGAGIAWGYVGTDQGGFSGAGDERRYATGDLARRRRDGTVEFVGRTDDQVKVGGVRIDLTEVDAQLLAVPGVRAAAAALRPNRVLVAAVVVGPGLDGPAVRRRLAGAVPAAFLPADVVVVDALPRTDRGKLDRAAVADLAVDLGGPPRRGLERTIATAMAELVGGGPLQRDESFFRRGGDSLGLLQLSATLADLTGRHLDVGALITAATPAAAAATLGGADRRGSTPATAVAPTTARSLGEAIACGYLAPLDGAAICCVPDLARPAIGTGTELRALVGELPVFAGIRDTPHGRLGIILVPCYASEAASEGPFRVEAAARLAACFGARAISLTGGLAPATGYGASLGPRVDGAVVTTGQAATAAAMVSAWAAACRVRNRSWREEELAVLGPGAIGDAFAGYASARMGPGGSVVRLVTPDTGRLASATSVVVSGLDAGDLALDRLPRDALVVEYGTGLSPDVAPGVVSGGAVVSPEPVDDLIHAPDLLRRLDPALVQAALDIDTATVAACALAAVLVADHHAPAVRAVPTPAMITSYRSALDFLGYRPKPAGR